MEFKLSDTTKKEETNVLEQLKNIFINPIKENDQVKKAKEPADSEYDGINVVSFKRSLYRLNANYKHKDYKELG